MFVFVGFYYESKRFHLILKPSCLPWFHLTRCNMMQPVQDASAEAEELLNTTIRGSSPTRTADSLTFDWKSASEHADVDEIISAGSDCNFIRGSLIFRAAI